MFSKVQTFKQLSSSFEEPGKEGHHHQDSHQWRQRQEWWFNVSSHQHMYRFLHTRRTSKFNTKWLNATGQLPSKLKQNQNIKVRLTINHTHTCPTFPVQINISNKSTFADINLNIPSRGIVRTQFPVKAVGLMQLEYRTFVCYKSGYICNLPI